LFVDKEQLPDGTLNPTIQFTYAVKAKFDDQTPNTLSGYSRPVTKAAVNDAPIVAGDPQYTVAKNKQLKIGAPVGVLANDSDVDSPASFLRAVRVTTPAHGTVVLNTDGSFLYTPTNGFVGVDTFTYKANNGLWSADTTVSLSADSNPVATVTITVTSK
jgi:VCBS repeat-containing protein